MRIVNTTDELEYRLGYADAVRILCEAGFEGLDYSMCTPSLPIYGDGYKTVVREIKAIAEGYGIPFTQTHGPFGRFQLDETAEREAFVERSKRALEVSAMLGADTMVMHPMRFMVGDHKSQLELNIEEFSKILPTAHELGVRIAIENMCLFRPAPGGRKFKHVCKSAEEHAHFIDSFNDDFVVACLDTGHAAISGEVPGEFARTLGKRRLAALHIQDNDGVHDMHTLPYNSQLDFDDFAEALADIDYEGDITMEACYFFTRNTPKELALASTRLVRDVAAYIRDEVLRYKAIKGGCENVKNS